MKRTFLILCLITICNISYADIASVGYVDSVVATKQDKISDIETIRSGAAAGATAVQPSSLPTVPTTISSFTNDSGYITTSYHDSTKQDKLPTGPSGGRYNLVWNGNTGNFVFELVPHSQCPSGTYDVGFSHCIDSATNGTAYGYITDGRGIYGLKQANTTVYGLTTEQTWGVTFEDYGNVKGITSCHNAATNENFSQTDKGLSCWCKMTEPATSSWILCTNHSTYDDCADLCASECSGLCVRPNSFFRSAMFSSVGN